MAAQQRLGAVGGVLRAGLCACAVARIRVKERVGELARGGARRGESRGRPVRAAAAAASASPTGGAPKHNPPPPHRQRQQLLATHHGKLFENRLPGLDAARGKDALALAAASIEQHSHRAPQAIDDL